MISILKYSFICFLLCFTVKLSAQDPAMDSLLSVLKTAKDDTNKVNLLYQLSEICATEDIMMYSRQCLALAEKLNYKKGIANAYNNIGYVYDNQGQMQLALEYFMKSLKLQEEIGNKDGMATSLTNLGSIYITNGQKEKSLELNLKALEIYKENNDKQGTANSLYNIGSIYSQLGQQDKALESCLKGFKMHEEINDKLGMGYSLNGIGNIYKDQGKLDLALDYYLRSLAIRKEINNPEGIAMSSINVGDIYLKQKKHNQAEDYSKNALTIARDIGYVESIMKSSQQLSEIYTAQEKYKDAMEMYVLFKQMSDSINNKETQKSLLQKQFQYELEKKEMAALVEQEKKDVIAREESQKQKIILWSVISGLVLVIVFAGFFLKRWRITQEQNTTIEKQKNIVERKNQNIVDSINYAQRIQSAILPKHTMVKSLFNDHFIFFKPKDVVSGDFYWAESKGDKIIFAVADCTGHGVPGAFMSMMGNALLNEIVNEQGVEEPDEILNRLKNGIIHALKQSDDENAHQDGMEIGLCVLNKKTNTLCFAGAYNSLYYFRDEKFTEYEGDKQAIGFERGKNAHFTKHTITVQKNDCIYLFTDGFADQKGGEGRRKFYYKPFKDLIASIRPLPMSEQGEIFNKTLIEWQGDLDQIDDILVMGIRI